VVLYCIRLKRDDINFTAHPLFKINDGLLEAIISAD